MKYISDMQPMQKNEIEALEYVGGYVICNLEKKMKRKSNSKEHLEVLHCFESDDVKDQALVNLLNRGGLRGITFNTKNIFTKAEYEFRRYTATGKSAILIAAEKLPDNTISPAISEETLKSNMSSGSHSSCLP